MSWLSTTNLRRLLRMHPKIPQLTQKQRALRQYKYVLYLLSVRAGGFRNFYYNNVAEARYRYEQNRHLTDPEDIELLIQFGDRWIEKNMHSQMYRIPYTEDGSKHQRNEAVPDELLDDSRYIDHEMLSIELSEWTGPEYQKDVYDEYSTWKHQY